MVKDKRGTSVGWIAVKTSSDDKTSYPLRQYNGRNRVCFISNQPKVLNNS